MQTNGMEDLEIIPYNYCCLILNKGTKNICWRKEPLQQMVLGKLDIYMQKTETRSLTLYNSQWIRVLNVKPEILKLL
jgi:hypothetical protein